MVVRPSWGSEAQPATHAAAMVVAEQHLSVCALSCALLASQRLPGWMVPTAQVVRPVGGGGTLKPGALTGPGGGGV